MNDFQGTDREPTKVEREISGLLQSAAAVHPGIISLSYHYESGAPETLYLTRWDGFTVEFTSEDGLATSDVSDGIPIPVTDHFNLRLAAYPTAEAALTAGFATTNDGIVFTVSRQW